MELNVLLMSIAKSVLCVGLFELMPSKMCCLRLDSCVFVECSGRNLFCVGAIHSALKMDIRVDFV